MAIVGRFPRSEQSRRRRRRRRLKKLAMVPTLLTLGNLLCGFAAVYFGLRAMYEFGANFGAEEVAVLTGSRWERMLPSFLSVGAGLVLVGMVFDGLDGLIARMTRSTTDFGGQLDSLADVVTCGVAPAILMVAFMTRELAGDAIVPSPISEHFLGRVAWISAAVYVAFTAIRLARYNVEHAKADFDHKSFRGLPSPGAAAVMVAMIIVQDQMGATARTLVLVALPLAALITAFLMVSRIPYRRLDRSYLLGRQPFGKVVFLLVVLAVFWTYKAPTLLLAAVLFALSGPAAWLLHASRERQRSPASDAAPAAEERDGKDRRPA